jgi:hypothetical protein
VCEFLSLLALYTAAPVVQIAGGVRVYVYICECCPYGLCVAHIEAHVYHCLYTHSYRVGGITQQLFTTVKLSVIEVSVN